MFTTKTTQGRRLHAFQETKYDPSFRQVERRHFYSDCVSLHNLASGCKQEGATLFAALFIPPTSCKKIQQILQRPSQRRNSSAKVILHVGCGSCLGSALDRTNHWGWAGRPPFIHRRRPAPRCETGRPETGPCALQGKANQSQSLSRDFRIRSRKISIPVGKHRASGYATSSAWRP